MVVTCEALSEAFDPTSQDQFTGGTKSPKVQIPLVCTEIMRHKQDDCGPTYPQATLPLGQLKPVFTPPSGHYNCASCCVGMRFLCLIKKPEESWICILQKRILLPAGNRIEWKWIRGLMLLKLQFSTKVPQQPFQSPNDC